jgi:hypothetical protein
MCTHFHGIFNKFEKLIFIPFKKRKSLKFREKVRVTKSVSKPKQLETARQGQEVRFFVQTALNALFMEVIRVSSFAKNIQSVFWSSLIVMLSCPTEKNCIIQRPFAHFQQPTIAVDENPVVW